MNRWIVWLVVIGLFSCQNKPYLWQSAQPMLRPVGTPSHSDVCFSSRWERPRHEGDTLETFSAAKSFHATRLDWVYTTRPEFISKADSFGLKVHVALSPAMPDLPFGSGRYERGRLRTRDGKPVTAPWMSSWNNWWGCVNHPDFREIYASYIQLALDAGAAGFQVDDPAMGFLLHRNRWAEVCYCDYCLRKADSLRSTPPEILESSIRDFHLQMKKMAEQRAGRTVPFSCNNFEGDWELFPFRLFDYGVAEIPERRANPEYLYAALREASRLHKGQVFTFAHERTWLVQKMIATTYACGGQMIVPWDVYQGSGKERYFGRPEQYAHLYGFIRAIAPWLDGYEDAFYLNTQDDLRYARLNDLPFRFETHRRQFHAFARARPGQPEAPIVIHLLEWHPVADSCVIWLNNRQFFRKGIASVELLLPVGYDRQLHEEAAATGHYDQMAQHLTPEVTIRGKWLRLQIPPLEHHWGVLVVRGRQ